MKNDKGVGKTVSKIKFLEICTDMRQWNLRHIYQEMDHVKQTEEKEIVR